MAVLGAANCVVPLADGGLRAENTDVSGFLGALEEDADVTPENRRVVVIGAGGAARAVVHAVQLAGAEDIVVVNRTAERGRIAAGLAPSARVGSFADVEGADIVVNATSVGMASDLDDPRAVPCPVEFLQPGQVAVDLVYSPPVTEWVRQLRARGVQAHNGLSMLVHQAAAAFELWTSVPAPMDAMKRAAATAESG